MCMEGCEVPEGETLGSYCSTHSDCCLCQPDPILNPTYPDTPWDYPQLFKLVQIVQEVEETLMQKNFQANLVNHYLELAKIFDQHNLSSQRIAALESAYTLNKSNNEVKAQLQQALKNAGFSRAAATLNGS